MYSTHRFIRKVLSLPFLPAEQITETFNTLKDTVDTEKITKLMDYINNTWINGSTWKPASWTVYRQSVRTNNDVEGWHHRINRKAQKPNLQMYILIILLHKEARLLPTQLKMVTGKTSTLPKKENQGAAAQDFRIVGQVQ